MSTATISYPLVPLGEVLSHRKEFIEIDDLGTYKRCRVQLHAQGIVIRDVVAGAEVKTKRQQVCRPGEFLVAEIDAKLGGFGIVPPELNEAIVSSHYFLFEVDETKLDRKFLGYYIRTAEFRDQVAAQGSTNYAAIRPRDVLGYTIPLPPLAEQRRVVARIDEVAAKIAEARRLRAEAVEEGKGLCRSIIFRAEELTPTPLGELLRQRELEVDVSPEETYHFAGVYSFGEGVFRGQKKKGAEFAYTRLSRLRSGDFVYPKLMAWEGALGIVPPECDGLVVSPEFPVFEVDVSRALPETLDIYFRTPAVWPTLAGASTGTNIRRRRINPSDFLAYRFPLPPMEVQRHLRIVSSKVNALGALQSETAAELDALLPAVLDQAFRGEL